MIYTGELLLASIKRKASIPSNSTRFTDADLLSFANESLLTEIAPMLISSRQEFMVFRETLTLAANTSSYQIPRRAVGRQFRDVTISVNGGSRRLDFVEPERFYQYADVGTPSGFAFEGDKIVFLPTPNTAFTASVAFHFRPSAMIKASAACVVASIGATTVTVVSALSTIDSNVAVDFVSSKSGSAVLAYSKTVTNKSGTTLTFAAGDIPSDLAVGDYVCVAEQSPVPTFVPEECHPLLASMVACTVLEAIGDMEALGAARKRQDDELKAVLGLLVPRAAGQKRVIIPSHPLIKGRRNPRRLGYTS